ncbi:hypothetical protein [uncultured Maribacter sp.]|uniref:hypothetical protein n=1 Tax=uncultured Maribacter sp. TaxID=431308 RepID=UPI0026088A96|nr:hypothetical protein [uncultured Maribacter sp.]
MSQKNTVNTFEVTISTINKQLNQGEELFIIIVVKNISDSSAKFCKYHTPFEGIKNEIFEVVKNGKEISYQGKLKKRSPPTKEDYINLRPGQSKTCKVSLNQEYNIENKGTYRIRFLGSGISQLNDSNEITFEIR